MDKLDKIHHNIKMEKSQEAKMREKRLFATLNEY